MNRHGLLLVAVALTGSCHRRDVPPTPEPSQAPEASQTPAALELSAPTTIAANEVTPSAPGQGSDRFPLAASSNRRYLVTKQGAPFLLSGDAPQCITARLSPADMVTFFSIRAKQGFNAAWVNAICNKYTGGDDDAATYDGVVPFTARLDAQDIYDIRHPNPAFFDRVDATLTTAARFDTVVFLNPIETGGFLKTLQANGLEAARAYGRFLGQRYAGHDNIVWLHGNDFVSWHTLSDDRLVQAVALGIRDYDKRHLHTIELSQNVSSSLDDAANWASHEFPIIGINSAYTYAPTYAQLHKDYRRPDFLPTLMVEGNYEFEHFAGATHPTNAHDIRTQYYWSLLSGAAGSFYGNQFTWPLETHWREHMNDPGAVQLRHVLTLFAPRKWYALVPDFNSTLLVSGRGRYSGEGNAQDNDYVTAASTPDGTLAIAYLPTARPIGVVLSKLVTPIKSQWFDPTTGEFSDASVADGGVVTLTPPAAKHADGFDDWVLVLESTGRR
jgi:hypothetical protein